MNLGRNIKEMRERTGYTQRQVADRLQVTPAAVSKWERNTNEPNIGQVTKMCDMFGCTIQELLQVEEKFLSGEEIELLSMYRKVPYDVQEIVLTILRSRVKEQNVNS
jgi:transcriptional regulator with XRE-family HTH domain